MDKQEPEWVGFHSEHSSVWEFITFDDDKEERWRGWKWGAQTDIINGAKYESEQLIVSVTDIRFEEEV